MPSPLTVSMGNKSLAINSGDLSFDTFAQFRQAGLTLVSDVLEAIHDQPVSSISTDKIEAHIATGTTLSWMIGNIGLRLTPQVQSTLTIRKAGEIFRYSEAENDDDAARRQIFTVPAGKACVSIALRVNLQVAGSGTFSGGHLGIRGSVQSADNFLLANHFLVDASDPGWCGD
jgi:hypothetical protein